jgi:amidase
MNEVVLKSATGQLELLRSGRISITELAEAHIGQIERLEPRLNAFADFDAERVRSEARRLEAVRGERGPLGGEIGRDSCTERVFSSV